MVFITGNNDGLTFEDQCNLPQQKRIQIIRSFQPNAGKATEHHENIMNIMKKLSKLEKETFSA